MTKRPRSVATPAWPAIERTANALLSGRPLDQGELDAPIADRLLARGVHRHRETGPGCDLRGWPLPRGPSQPGRIPSLLSRSLGRRRSDNIDHHPKPAVDDVKPKPLFARLTLPANAVDVTAEAAITAVTGAGRYTLEEQAMVRLSIRNASSPSEIDAAFAILVDQRIGALLAGTDALFDVQYNQLVALATRHAVPTIYSRRRAVEAGGLMSYGANFSDAGTYAGRILKGEKPGDLPVQQSTRIEMVLNLKTAKVLGLSVPQSTLLRADEVIE